MATFPCFASSFDFFTNAGPVVDVATIITDFRARVLGQVPAWTEPIANNFQSPVDGAGRFMTVVLARTSATQLSWIVKDQNGIQICTRDIDIDVAGNAVNYYTGQFHAVVETQRAVPEIAQAGIIDETPEAQGSIANYVFGNGYRNAGGAIDGQGGAFFQFFALDNGVSGMASRVRGFSYDVGGTVIGLPDGAGAIQFFPMDMRINLVGVNKWIGRGYQSYICDQSIAAGTNKVIRIGDAGETGTFRVLGGLATAIATKQMVRSA